MAKREPYRNQIELLQGTLDMLVLRTLQWGPQHGRGVGQAIRLSDTYRKAPTGERAIQVGRGSPDGCPRDAAIGRRISTAPPKKIEIPPKGGPLRGQLRPPRHRGIGIVTFGEIKHAQH